MNKTLPPLLKMLTKDEAFAKGSNISKHCWIAESARFEHPVHISSRCEIHDSCQIGARSFVNVDTIIYQKAKIGRYVTIARNCEIAVASHPVDWLSTSSFQYKYFTHCQYEAHKVTHIGNDVWIGSKAIIGNGVLIGDGAIVAAGAVVVKDVPPYAIVGGIPAKVIRYRFSDEIIARLLLIKWWDMPMESLRHIDFKNIENAIIQLESLIK